MRRLTGKRPHRIRRAVKHRNRNHTEQPAPVSPSRELGKDVRTHDPDEILFRETVEQRRHGVDGIACAKAGLDIGNDDPGIACDFPCRCQSIREGRHAAGRFQRILRRDQPPDRVEPQTGKRLAGINLHPDEYEEMTAYLCAAAGSSNARVVSVLEGGYGYLTGDAKDGAAGLIREGLASCVVGHVRALAGLGAPVLV